MDGPGFTDLASRVVLVTGASTGIGAAVARGFAACGARVTVHCNRKGAVSTLTRGLAQEFAREGIRINADAAGDVPGDGG